MALNDLLEQLAFGKSLPEMSSCIGLYLSGGAAYVAEVRLAAGKPAVERLIRVPLPAPRAAETRVTGALNTDLLADADRVAGLLKQAMSQAKWKSEHAVVSLSHNFGILRYFAMPAIDARFWRMAIPAEAKKYIPIQFEDLVNDYQVEPLPAGPDKRPRQGALFGVTQRKTLESLRAVLQRLGLTLVGVELSPCSVSRVWDSLDKGPAAGPYAQVHFDAGTAHVVLSERGLPIFVREVQLGAEAKVADRRKLDLAGCVDFAKKQLGAQRPARVRLSGSSAEMAAWQEALAQEIGVPAIVQDTRQTLAVKGGEWGGLAAVGAGLRHLVKHPITLDLSASGRADDLDKRAVNGIFTLAGAALVVLATIGLVRFGIAYAKSQELARLSQRGATLAAFQGKTADSIRVLIENMQRRANSIGSVSNTGVKVTRLLERLAEDIPEQAWISGVSYANSLEAIVGEMPASAEGRTMTLTGYTSGPSEAAEQDLAFQFKDNLLRDERFTRAFASVEVFVQAAKRGGGTLELPPERLEQRTEFKILCARGKRGG